MITCEFENGGKASLRHVTVDTITFNEKGEILLVKRAPNLLRGGKYDLPGGFMDHDENMQETALRELFEETGINGEIQFLLRINDKPRRKEDRQNVNVIYVVRAIGGIIKLDSESTEANWFSQKNLPGEEEFAFDHRDSILLYFKYLKEPFKLPIIG